MNLNFVGNRITFYILSTILIVGSVVLLVSKGLNFGIEFKSGSVFRLSFQEEASVVLFLFIFVSAQVFLCFTCDIYRR